MSFELALFKCLTHPLTHSLSLGSRTVLEASSWSQCHKFTPPFPLFHGNFSKEASGHTLQGKWQEYSKFASVKRAHRNQFTTFFLLKCSSLSLSLLGRKNSFPFYVWDGEKKFNNEKTTLLVERKVHVTSLEPRQKREKGRKRKSQEKDKSIKNEY